jgi:lysophospholipase L1-like esterase
MITRVLLFTAFAAASLVVAQDKASTPKAFEFKDGEKIVLLGSTVLEREQRYGWFESMLSVALADKNVTVRNLAWSGDTVFGDARSYFGPPAEGMTRLAEHIDMLDPTVVILCYGTDLAHDGLSNLPDFLSGYRSLLELVRQKSPGVRLIIACPPPMETLAPPLPDQLAANKNLATLRDALSKFAHTQNAFFVDWFASMGGMPKPGVVAKPLTENGIHYTSEGYRKLSSALLQSLGINPPDVPVNAMEPLRKAVIAKDFLFFNRWRPQNETYLFGFRKHEQGQNAKEIPMFDPLIADADKKIDDLKNAAVAASKHP